MNSAQGVYMDTDAVRNFSKNFGTISEVLFGVSKAMETLSTVLKATAFVGLVGGYAVAQVIDQIQPRIEELAEKCEEISGDLDASVDAYERGDELGSTRFH
ncbi:MAG: type VII secretion target [Ardenticatenaceae bacterium]|nr:type VII secretion target [Ardenticatenaceae bacterium]